MEITSLLTTHPPAYALADGRTLVYTDGWMLSGGPRGSTKVPDQARADTLVQDFILRDREATARDDILRANEFSDAVGVMRDRDFEARWSTGLERDYSGLIRWLHSEGSSCLVTAQLRLPIVSFRLDEDYIVQAVHIA